MKGKTPNYQTPLSVHSQVGCDCTLCGVMIMTAGESLYAKVSPSFRLGPSAAAGDFDLAISKVEKRKMRKMMY